MGHKKNGVKKKAYALKLLIVELVIISIVFIAYYFKVFDLFLLIYIMALAVSVSLIVYVINNDGFYIDNYDYGKMRVKKRILSFPCEVDCENVLVVHYEKENNYNKIIMLTNSQFRNKKIKKITGEFIDEYPLLLNSLRRLKSRGERNLYYIIIKKNKIVKEKFIEYIYRSCVGAIYTEQAIEVIKEWQKK